MHTITTRTLVASCTLLTLAACGGRNAGDSAAAGADSLGAAASGAAATMTDSLGMRSDSMGGRNSGDNVSLADANTTA
nr:hypothetical protein [Gemmatimonadaceae bacterium]